MCPNGNSLSERVYDAIRTTEREKAAKRICPDHALLLADLCRMSGFSPEAVRRACVQLYRQRRISGGHTINDNYFRTL